MNGVALYVRKIKEEDADLGGLPEAMIQALDAIANGPRRMEKAASYRLLVDGLREEGWLEGMPVIGYEEGGKPYLENYEGININLSHCRTHVAVAMSRRGRVGVDVESRRRVSDRVIDYACSEEEKSKIAEAEDGTMEFLRLWTRKEAYLKCIGTGITGEMRGLPPDRCECETHPLTDGEGWVTVCFIAEGV